MEDSRFADDGFADDRASAALTVREEATWDVLWAVYNALPQQLDSRLKKSAGVNHVEYRVLAALAGTADGNMRMNEVACAAGLRTSHLSRVVTRLERDGLVARQTCTVDRRAIVVTIQAAGYAVVSQAEPTVAEHARSVLFDVLTDEEEQTVARAMRKMAHRLAAF